MIRRRQISLAQPILAAALTALLLLGTLQYHWATQMGASEQARMQATLHAATERFGEDFDRELARIYLGLQIDAATLRDGDWERFARRYSRFVETAPFPGLVSHIYLATVESDATLRLQRYDPQARTFVPAPWPAALAPARRAIIDSYRTSYVARGVLVSTTPEALVDDPPALIIPAARTWLLSDQQQLDFEARFLFGDTVIGPAEATCLSCEPVKGGMPLFAHTIVTLDETYLAEMFVPSLAQRIFATGGTLDYALTIAPRAAPERVLYSSHPAADAPPAADASVAFFSLRLDELNRFVVDESLSDIEAGSRRTSVAFGLMGGGRSGTEPRWQLNVTHRAGSIARAAAEIRDRSLVLSLGSLLLLSASVVLILVLARRSQRLAQQKIDFVTVVSHELRSPLSVICAAGENLADGVIQDAERARQYGAVIRSEGRRLSEMVEHVLAYAQIQGGQPTYTLAPADPAAIVAQAVAACRLQIQVADATVETVVDPELPQIAADTAALTNAVQNLVANGVKYGGERPLVTVRVARVAGPRGAEVRITVTDRGIGIATEDLPHIFEPFYRSRDVIAAQIHGSGLGLRLVEHIAQAHGGGVSVESTPGKGSTFTLRLPALEGQKSEARSHEAEAGGAVLAPDS